MKKIFDLFKSWIEEKEEQSRGSIMLKDKLGFRLNNSEKEKWTKLFLIFLRGLPEVYLAPGKIIPFTISYLPFINHRVLKADAKALIKQLEARKFLIKVRTRGYRINWNKVQIDGEKFKMIAQNIGFQISQPNFQFLLIKKWRSSDDE
jgi:hypothetical protein